MIFICSVNIYPIQKYLCHLSLFVINQKETFKKIELIVEVSRRTIKFFDSAILFDVDNVPIIVKLPKIPLREITFEKDSNFSSHTIVIK